MKYQPGLVDNIISPFTGKIRRLLFDLQKDYIIIGNQNNEALASPILIDIRLKLIEILTNLGQAKFIIQTEKEGFEDSQVLDQLTNGFLYNTNGILSIQTPGEGSIALPYGQVLVGDEDDLAKATQLLNKQLLIGNSSDRAEAITVLFLENMANLSNKRIWRGNTSGRPEESDAVTNLESSLSNVLSDLANLANIINTLSNTVNALSSTVDALESSLALIGGVAAITLLQLQVLGLLGAVAGLDSRLTTAESEIDVLQGQTTDIYNQLTSINTQITNINDQITSINTDISTIYGEIDDITFTLTTINNELTAINTRIDNLRLNTIPADGDVSFYGYKLTNLADGDDPLDGVNIRTLKLAIEQSLDNITLDGFVNGEGDPTGEIHTTRGDDCVLNNIPATADVSISNHKLIDLADATDPLDGVNLRTLENTIAQNLDNITLDGFVEGDSDETGLIHTTRGPDCLLTNIPAGGDVSLDNYAITNLETLTANTWEELEAKALNGINFLFLWQLFGGEVEYVP